MKPLPTTKHPVFELTVPSSSEEIEFRRFLVREEKILLIAQQEDSDKSIIRAILQIINNCAQNNADLSKLTTFDVEYLYLKLRAKSVDNIAKVSYIDQEDGETYDFEIDLESIKMPIPKCDFKIKISDTSGIMMKWPAASIIENMNDVTTEVEIMNFFIRNCIDSVYDAEDVWPATDYTAEELDEFVDGLDVQSFNKIKEFFKMMPKLEHTITYTNKKGNERKIVLRSLRDFFMWG